ncbi:uncharacterized protein [Aristolochia californica]|uniref:uncharacterized protein n=1 Tax=Aristolochia californica TaxID=171875 RepID=UPI0035DE18EB
MAAPSRAPFLMVRSLDRFIFVTIPSTDMGTFSISIRRNEKILRMTRLLDGSLTATENTSSEYTRFDLDPAVMSSPIAWYQVVNSMLSHFNFGTEAHYRVVDKLQSFRHQSATSEASDIDIEVQESAIEEVLPMPRANDSFSLAAVEVLPTPSANDSFSLEAFLRGLKLKVDGEMGEEESCCVCMNEFGGANKVAVETPCSHIFHRACLASWLIRSPTCPVCRSTFQIHS